jgi:thioredoxin reductase (NADPH)
MNVSTTEYDVLIVGGGPAGIAAGIWCSELGMSSAIIESSSAIGGQLLNIFNPIENYPGVIAKNGTELRDRFVKNLEARNCEVLLNCEVDSFDFDKLEVAVASGNIFKGKAIVLAMGVRRRRLDVPGEEEFLGKGILHSGAKEAAMVSGKRVLVVGGGDAAVENVLILSKYAKDVILVHRGSKLSARSEFVEQLNNTANVTVMFETEIRSFTGEDKLSSATLANKNTNAESILNIDNAIVRIGFQPNSELLVNHINCNESGYVMVDRSCRTNFARVFAAGDLCRPSSQTIASSIGDAVTAIAEVFKRLCHGSK